MKPKFARTLAAALVAALAFGTTASAGHHEGGEKKKPGHGHHFERKDANGDGTISKEEWIAASEARFSKVDANGDGTVSREEMSEAHQRMREKMKEHRAEHGHDH